MARFGREVQKNEVLSRDVELALCDVVEKEIALQRILEKLKKELAECPDYTPRVAF
jgi:hypothetical protein